MADVENGVPAAIETNNVTNSTAAAAEKKKKKKKKASANSTSDANNQVVDQQEQSATTNNNVTESTDNNDNAAATESAAATDSAAAKKKKKKAASSADKKDEKPTKGKGPGKKMLAAIQEQIAKAKEEEIRRLKEEEEVAVREAEQERVKLEKEKKKQDLRDKRKQKEKARKEKLKKEGKYLTAKQKADKQRAQASLELLKQQGLIKFGSLDKEEEDEQDDLASKNDKELNDLQGEDDEENKLSDEELNADKLDEADDESEVSDEESEEDIVENWEDIEVKNDKKKKKPILENISNKEANVKNQVNNVKKSNNKEPEAPNNQTAKLINQQQQQQQQSQQTTTVHKNKHLRVNAILQIQEEETLLRSPIICVLGHVDTGKTKLLDYIRKTHVQDNEAGGITQQIGATFVPPNAIKDQCKISKQPTELEIPGLLIIDTPGHESFTNLRSRGSSLCDMAILVIDIMHGLEPQTIESINLLKARKTPFIVALNKIDRLYNWKNNVRRDIEDLINSQQQNTKLEFEKRTKEIILQLNEKSFNAALYYENPDVRSYVSLVPTSAVCGDGMGNLINLLSHYCQSMLHKKLIFLPNKLEATVLEVKALPGLGTTIDVVLVNGRLNEGDKVVLAGHDGPIATQIRSLLVPQPLRELRVKTPYQELRSIKGSIGVKICGHDLDKAVAGLELYVAKNELEIERLKAECWERFGKAMRAIKCVEKGVYVQASTLGSLEALLEFLKKSKIPVCGVRIGPVVKRDVMKASIMLENSPDHAVILAFDVKVERDAQEMADNVGLRIFTADIIYHLFDKFTAYSNELKEKRKAQYRNVAVFPCKLKILPQCIFNARNPIVLGVSVEDGILVSGTPIAVPSKEFIDIGKVSSIEYNHKVVESARKGQEVCVKIEHVGGDAPRLYGRHFDHEDMLMSKISRESIDACKEYFRDDFTKDDWKLMIELKSTFKVL